MTLGPVRARVESARMIVFELICAEEHRFEGWFGSSEEFDAQLARGLLACPVCASDEVRKLPAAKIRRPAFEATAAAPPAAPDGKAQITLAAFLDHVLKHTEDVGRRFPEEARKIHNQEAPNRSIRGVASRDEAEALADEGIAVFALPIPPVSDMH
jgi:hypothetical protein